MTVQPPLRGDLVIVVTFNRGLPVRQRHNAREPAKAATWEGKIVGPSVLGPGWWNVQRRVNAKGRYGYVYAVPDGEIEPRKR